MTTNRGLTGLHQRLLAIAAALALIASLMVVFVPVAGASIDLSIPLDTIISAPSGSETLLTTVDSGDLEGLECTVSADTANQDSVHPENDLVVSSGNTSVVLEDVESQGGITIEADGVLVLGPTVSITLVMGLHNRFSAGVTVHLDCDTAPEEVTVSVTANACVVDEQGVASGSVDVSISPDSGATVSVYSDAALQNEVASFSGSGGSASLSPGTYFWQAVAADGFELTGEGSGQFTIAECEANVIVTNGDCTDGEDGEQPGFVSVQIDPDGAATVVVLDSGDNVVASFNSDGSSNLEPGEYTWEATAEGGFALTGPTTGSFTVDDCDEPPTEVADIAVSKIDLVDPVVVDSDNPTAQVTYEITVTNNGPVTAESVVAEDTLPSTVTFVSATPDVGTCAHAAGVVTCDLGDLASGDSVTITVVVETEAVGEVTDPTLLNIVVVSTTTDEENLSNNTDDEETSIVEVLADTVDPEDPQDPEVLPFTGDETGFLLAASAVLMTGGYATLLVARRREDG